jgi:hypothetical protein
MHLMRFALNNEAFEDEAGTSFRGFLATDTGAKIYASFSEIIDIFTVISGTLFKAYLIFSFKFVFTGL